MGRREQVQGNGRPGSTPRHLRHRCSRLDINTSLANIKLVESVPVERVIGSDMFLLNSKELHSLRIRAPDPRIHELKAYMKS